MLALHTPNIFFNYRKTRTPLTPLDNSKKTEVKNLQYPLILGKKKFDPRGYTITTPYKKCENALQTLAVFFFFQ
jgi:hypothetical protein